MKIKKGDTVVVVAGKDKGARGKVIQSYPDRNKVLVEGVNRIKKHTPIRQASGRGGTTGGIVTQEAPIHVSNVMLVHDGKAVRVGYKVEIETAEDGTKTRRKVRVARGTAGKGKEI